MLPYQHWDKIMKKFASEDLKGAELPLTHMWMYFRGWYALWLDFRSCDDHKLHGSGQRVENRDGSMSLFRFRYDINTIFGKYCNIDIDIDIL